jgi:hypothetical protein
MRLVFRWFATKKLYGILNESCVPANVTICNFTISDFGQDGITGGENGFFTFYFGATTVAKSEYGKSAPFAEQSYCFGSGCNIEPLEETDDDGMDDDETMNVWVANVTILRGQNKTQPLENESKRDHNDTVILLVNVTVRDKNESKTKDNNEPNDMAMPNNSDPGDVGATPEPNKQTTTRSEQYKSSKSSLVIIVSVIFAVLVGLAMVALCLRKRKTPSHTRGIPLSPCRNHNPEKNKLDHSAQAEDDESSKTSNDNVHEAETFVTYDSIEKSAVLKV